MSRLTTDEILLHVKGELRQDRAKFPDFHSSHEGFAVLKEEVDELWDEVKGNGATMLKRDEAIQVAAMAVRFIEDCCGEAL